MMNEDLLHAINILKSGQREEARSLLIAILRNKPDNEIAWQWMYNVANNQKEKTDCLKQILRINPENTNAKELLDKFPAPILNKVETSPLIENKKITTTPIQQNNMQIGIVAVVFVCIVCICGAMAMSGGKKEKDYKTMAGIYCQIYLQNLLKSPSSAKFPSTSQTAITELDNMTFEIRSYVDAQNSFGAMLRKYYYCKIQYVGTEQDDETQAQFWKLIDIQLFD